MNECDMCYNQHSDLCDGLVGRVKAPTRLSVLNSQKYKLQHTHTKNGGVILESPWGFKYGDNYQVCATTDDMPIWMPHKIQTGQF